MPTITPLVLSENLFNTQQYRSHVVTAEEESVTDSRLWVGRGQRSRARFWTSTTANSDTWIEVLCDRVRAANCVVIDRGHNLAGKTVRVQCSNDDFTTTETAFSGIIPSASAPGDVDDALGVRTEEGAWIKRFDTRVAKYWRLYIDAMGSGLTPRIVGLYLGLAWEPPIPDFPWAEDDDELGGDEHESNAGWIGSARHWNRRQGTLNLRLDTEAEYDEARLWLHGFYRQRSPMWLVMDQGQAERAVCAVRPKGVMSWRVEREWLNRRQAQVAYVEHEPLSP